MRVVDRLFAPDAPFSVIAGPCAIESEAVTLRVARELASIATRTGVPVLFKASYLKDNRTRGDAFRGPGLEPGLAILERVREETGLPVTSDVHGPEEARRAGAVLDVVQIPAFLCRQTSLVEAAAGTGRPLNIKKGQFLPPGSVRYIVEKARAAGAAALAITERGSSFGYGDLVVDPRVFPLLATLPVLPVFDVTHALQRPGGGETGGDRTFARPLARAALAAGARALFFETHPDPAHATSDRETQLPLEEVESFIVEMRDVAAALARVPSSGADTPVRGASGPA